MNAPISVIFFGLLATASLLRAADAPISFARDIRPILSDNCFHCHGFDPKDRKGGRRIDTEEGALADNDGVRAIVPGDLAKSDVWVRLISTDDDEVMPPPKSHKTVTPAQKELIRRWIEQGAKYESHWAFTPVTNVPLPEVKQTAWPRGEIDRFILARIEKEGLTPSAEADKTTLIRRVTLDLTGLPPTPQEVQAFVADSSADAYEKLVARLLHSPRFGERMAVDWLDAARYADTHGFNNDSARTMWRWRDWVIEAFNANLPYDRFITEQLAGDLLPKPTLDQRIATGFCRNHVINSEGGIIEEEYRVEYVADRVRTMSTAWLGVTMECVRCHDHKFDPITQRDYYGLFAFFNNVPEHGEDGRVANAVPFISAPTREQQRELAKQRKTLGELDARLSALAVECREPAASAKLTPPAVDDADLKGRVSCDSRDAVKQLCRFPMDAPELMDGVVGTAWVSSGNGVPVEFLKGVIDFAKAQTFACWLRPDAANPRDVALLSNVSYAGNPEQQGYARGHEVRLSDGEIEVRGNTTFPAYALRVRSEGAKIRPDQWRHIVVRTSGNAKAAGVRIFIDGREVATRMLYDGMVGAGGAGVPLNFGAERTPNAPVFRGALDEVRIYRTELPPARIAAIFAAEAWPFAQARATAGAASEVEREWMREAGLRVASADYAKVAADREALWEKHLEVRRAAPTAMVMQEMPKPRAAFVLKRGAYDARGDEVTAAAPAIIAPWPEGAPRNRLGLAQWLTQPSHPLTARVVVNRFWAQLFGTGIVKTLEDFGSQGEYPSHPELLDWMAKRFVDSGWDVKALMRTVVLSATYRQSSRVTLQLLERDPENRLLARAPRLRLGAEFLRDQALAVSSLLRERIGGPSVFPMQPEGLYNGIVVGADYPGTKWELSSGDDLFRRSLYTFWKRTVPHPVMLLFDAPDREFCTVRRSRTNTPLQALALMNEPAFVEAAKKLGSRIEAEGGATDEARLRWGFRLVTARDPRPDELRELQRAIDDARRDQIAAPFAAVASILLNLDECLTRE